MPYNPLDGALNVSLSDDLINASFDEVAGWFAGATAPVSAKLRPFMKWLDTSDATLPLYVRNLANTAWVRIREMAGQRPVVFCDVDGDMIKLDGPAAIVAGGYKLVLPGATGTAVQSLRIASVVGTTLSLEWFTPAGGVTALPDLSDVTIAAPTDGQVLTWDSGTSQWVNETPVGGGGNLDSLSDVVITSPAATHHLRHNGTNWVNALIPAGDIPDLSATYAARSGSAFTGDLLVDNQKELRLGELDANGVNYVGLRAAATMATDYLLTLPAAAPAAGQILESDGSGVLAWLGSSGTGNLVRNTSPTITTPNISSFTNAQHSHLNAAGGGTLDAAAIAAGVLAIGRIPDLSSLYLSLAGGTLTNDLLIDNQNELRLGELDASGANFVALRAAGTMSADYTLTLPAAGPGANNRIMEFDSTGAAIFIATPAGGGGGNLDSLSDVVITSPAATHHLRHDGANWVNAAIPAGDIPNLDASKITTGVFGAARIPDLSATYLPLTGGTLTNDLLLDNQQELRLGELDANGVNFVALRAAGTMAADYTLTLPAAGPGANNRIMEFDSSGNAVFIATPAGGSATNLDGLTDVVITTPTLGDMVRYNGTDWRNAHIGMNDLPDLSYAVVKRDRGCAADLCLENGWTLLVQSATGLKYHVSPRGNNSNDGLTPNTAKLTIAAAKALLRPVTLDSGASRFDDWLCIEEGTVWNEVIGQLTKGGLSAVHPLVVTTYKVVGNKVRYGEGLQATIAAGDQTGFTTAGGVSNQAAVLDDISLVNLKFYNNVREPGAPGYNDGLRASGTVGINVLHRVNRFLLEGCDIGWYGQNTNFSGEGAGHNAITLRRNVTHNSYAEGLQLGSGFYSANTTNLVIEDNVSDHNGHTVGASGVAPVPRAFNSHDIYLDASVPDAVVRRNFLLRAGSTGAQFRGGGDVQYNVWDQNPTHIYHSLGGTNVGNVYLEANDINLPDNPRAIGIELKNVASGDSLLIGDNIFAHHLGGLGARAIYGNNSDNTVENVTLEDNIVYHHGECVNWYGAIGQFTNVKIRRNDFQGTDDNDTMIRHTGVMGAAFDYDFNRYYTTRDDVGGSEEWFGINDLAADWTHTYAQWVTATGETGSSNTQVTYPDPTRNLAKYHAAIGGVGTVEAFCIEVRKQTKANWRGQYTALSVINWIREGFGKAPISGGPGAERVEVRAAKNTAAYALTLPAAGPGANNRMIEFDINGIGTFIATPAGGGGGNLDSLSDVVITSPAATDHLRYNGTNWVNAVIPAGDVPDLSATYAARAGSSFAGDVLIDNQKELRLGELDANGANFVGIRAAGTMTADYLLTLPAAAPAAGQIPESDGSGILSWRGSSGTGDLVRVTSPSITTPTIASLTNAQHTHQNAAGGGTLDAAAIAAGVLASARIPDLSSLYLSLAGGTLTNDLLIDNQQELRLGELDASGANFVALRAAGTMSADYTLTLPAAGPGANNRIMEFDSTGAAIFIATPAGGGGGNLDSLSDVVITSPAATHHLRYDGANWVNALIPAGDIPDLSATYAARAGTTFTGDVLLDNQEELRLGELDSNGSNFVALRAAALMGADYTLTMPAAAPAAGNLLESDGSGNLAWLGTSGTGSVLRQTIPTITSPTITTPTIASFTNAQHTHQSAAGGGTLDAAAIAAGVLASARIPDLSSLYLALGGGVLTGNLLLDNQQELRLGELDASGANFVGLRAAGTMTADYLLTFPAAAPAAGEIPESDGSGVLSWRGSTGTGSLVRADSPTIVTPTIASLTNAQHTHQNAAGGGTLDAAAIAAGVLAIGRIPDLSSLYLSLAGGTLTNDLLIDNQQELRLGELDANGANYVGLRAAASVTADFTLTLPGAVPAADQVLDATDGSGTLGWRNSTGTGDIVRRTSPTLTSPTLSGSPVAIADVLIDDQKALRLGEVDANGTNSVGLRAAASMAADYTLTLPAAAPAAGQVPFSDGSGNLSWADRLFSISGTFLDSASARLVTLWRADKAATIVAVRAWRSGGTSASVNARVGASDVLTSDLATTADTWTSNTSPAVTAVALGDTVRIELAAVAGAPAEVVVQIDLKCN